MIGNRQSNEHHKACARSTVHALHKCAGALGSPTKHPGQKKLKAGVTEEGASDRTGNSITVNIVWQKNKK